MKYFFRVMRWPLGQLVILIDWLTRPTRPDHGLEKQAWLDTETATMHLYQFQQCPFCVKTRRNIWRLGLNIEARDARNDATFRQELVEQGGRYQVPCLRIENDGAEMEWLYESKEIIHYLECRFSQ